MSSFVSVRAENLGLKREDAKKPIKIEVSASDITNATRKNSRQCAFACAAKRGIPKVKHAYFFRTTAWLEYADRLVRYRLTPSMQKEVVAFDRGGAVAPGKYTLEPFSAAQTMKAMAKKNQQPKRSHAKTGKRAKKPHRMALVRTLHDPAFIAEHRDG
jgi:hypothetical protein